MTICEKIRKATELEQIPLCIGKVTLIITINLKGQMKREKRNIIIELGQKHSKLVVSSKVTSYKRHKN